MPPSRDQKIHYYKNYFTNYRAGLIDCFYSCKDEHNFEEQLKMLTEISAVTTTLKNITQYEYNLQNKSTNIILTLEQYIKANQ